ncbi:MAG: hypothetical protein JWO52_2432 [Gammaproteobacteria bacterium]|nr:hypothetical protein [Gammaproteobacteria bacterium]
MTGSNERRDAPCQGCSHFGPPRPLPCSLIRRLVLVRRDGHGSLTPAFGPVPRNCRSRESWSTDIGLPESEGFMKTAYLPRVEERSQK